ncbi:conserved hypothetical protein [Mesorhizobium sp. ORS 3324]|nr:conserved hypothetical protein [Mesorhizobium sp. ORS 3324]
MFSVDFERTTFAKRNAMSHPRQRDLASQESLGIDQEIALLLTAIEQETVPDRLTKLATELQNALIQKRRCEKEE